MCRPRNKRSNRSRSFRVLFNWFKITRQACLRYGIFEYCNALIDSICKVALFNNNIATGKRSNVIKTCLEVRLGYCFNNYKLGTENKHFISKRPPRQLWKGVVERAGKYLVLKQECSCNGKCNVQTAAL